MASIFDVPPPPVFTRDGRDGFPPESDFEGIMAEYIGGLNPRKRDKALMTQSMYDTILIILTNPNDTRCATAQFRFWTKKMFRLVTTAHAQIVTHENRPVAVKEQIYDVLVQCHSQCSHGGRDKTSNQVRRYYSWIPKELIARFVKACPLCVARRTAKSGTAGIAALTALGADPNLLLGANGGLIGDSSPPSESSNSTDSAVTTPSRQSRPPAMGNSQLTPFTPGSYLASAMYQQQVPLSASSLSSNLPPMPSPSHNPQDWTHWVNTTPQRIALAQSTSSSLSSASEALLNSNPTLHFSYHTDGADVDKDCNVQAISLQTPPQTASLDNSQNGSIAQSTTGDNVLQQSAYEAGNPSVDSAQLQDSQGQNPVISADTQAYYSQLMQQTMASFLQAPQMSHQWSSDSGTTASSASSASTYSSSELEDLDDVARNSPMPTLSTSQTGKDTSASTLQQQIDSLTAHFGGVNNAPSLEEDEEASFQSFMSTFKQPPVEQDQIDPLLRAMNLDVMNGIPLVGDAASPMPTQEMQPPILETAPAPKPAVGGRPAKLGGNNFKFPPAAKPEPAKKNDKKMTRSNSRSLSKGKTGLKDSKNSTTEIVKTRAILPKEYERPNSTGPSATSTPDLSSYFQLQNTFNQMREGMLTGSTPAAEPTASYSTHYNEQQGYNHLWNEHANGNDFLSQSHSAPLHGEFSFNVSDMSSEFAACNANISFEAGIPATSVSAPEDTKTRHRPPQLDFSSFSNNNAFSQQNVTSYENETSFHHDSSYLSAYPYSPSDFNQYATGSVSAPAHITQFTQPENPIVTPNVPLFNYEQQMDMNFDLIGNSFVDYSDLNMGTNFSSQTNNSDFVYGYPANGMANTSQAQSQEMLRPASAGGYLEPSSYASSQKTMLQMQQQQQMTMMPAIHSAPYFHLPMSSQQQQAQARELSEQIQAILDSAVPTNEALVEHATACTTVQSSRAG